MKNFILKALIVAVAFGLFMTAGAPAIAQDRMYEGSLGTSGHTITLVDTKGKAVIPPIKTDRSGGFTFSIPENTLKKHQKDGMVFVVKNRKGNVVRREHVGIIVVDGTMGIEPGDDFRPKNIR